MGPQEEYIETVVTCEGDFYDPEFHTHLQNLSKRLQNLLTEGDRKLIVKKVEPWNSVRVTFNIPKEAAVRLKQLAEQGDRTLRELGVLAVQIEGHRLISLTIAGKNNETTELVLHTSGTAAAAGTGSVFDLPGSDEINIPGPSNVESTTRNIVQYLRDQGGSGNLFNSLFNQNFLDNLKPPDTAGAAAQGAQNPVFGQFPYGIHSIPDHASGNRLQMHSEQLQLPPGISPGSFPSPSLPHTQAFSSPTTSHNQSPLSPNYPTPPPSVSNPSSPGSRTANFNNLAMSGINTAAALNSLPRLLGNRDITSSSPLLVNLLQNDIGGLANLSSLMPNKVSGMPFAVSDMGQPPTKRRRKSRKVKPDVGKSRTPAGQEVSTGGAPGSLPIAPGACDALQGKPAAAVGCSQGQPAAKTRADSLGQLTQEMDTGAQVSAAVANTSSLPLSSRPTSSSSSGNCHSPGQAMSPRVHSSRTQSPVCAQSPCWSKSQGLLGNNPPHIVNPVTGQLEPASCIDVPQAAGEHAAGKDGLVDSDDMVHVQLQPPPNPLVELNKDMTASKEVNLEVPSLSLTSQKQSSPKAIVSIVSSQIRLEEPVDVVHEQLDSVTQIRTVSTSTTTNVTGVNGHTDTELVRTNSLCSPSHSASTSPATSLPSSEASIVSTVTPAVTNSIAAVTTASAVSAPCTTSLLPTVMTTADTTTVSTSFHPLLSVTENTICSSSRPLSHSSSSSTVLPPPCPVSEDRPLVTSRCQTVSSPAPQTSTRGSQSPVDSLPSPVSSSDISLLTSSAPSGDVLGPSTPVVHCTTTVVTPSVSLDTSSKDNEMVEASSAVVAQEIDQHPEGHLHLQPEDSDSSKMQQVQEEPVPSSSSENIPTSTCQMASTSNDIEKCSVTVEEPSIQMSPPAKDVDTSPEISSTEVVDKVSEEAAEKFISSEPGKSILPVPAESPEDGIFDKSAGENSPEDEKNEQGRAVMNCESPDPVLSSATPEHSGTDGSNTSSVTAHSQGKDSGIADVGHGILGSIRCLAKVEDGNVDTPELGRSNGASTSEASPLSEADTVSSGHQSQSPSVRLASSAGLANHDSELSSHSFDEHICGASPDQNDVSERVQDVSETANDHDSDIKEELVDEQPVKTELHKCSSSVTGDKNVITVGYALSKDQPTVDLSLSGLSDKSLPFLTEPSSVFEKDSPASSSIRLREFQLGNDCHTTDDVQKMKKAALVHSPLNNGETQSRECLNWSKMLSLPAPVLLGKSDLNPGGEEKSPGLKNCVLTSTSSPVKGDNSVPCRESDSLPLCKVGLEAVNSADGASTPQSQSASVVGNNCALGISDSVSDNVQSEQDTTPADSEHSDLVNEVVDKVISDTRPEHGDGIKVPDSSSEEGKEAALSPSSPPRSESRSSAPAITSTTGSFDVSTPSSTATQPPDPKTSAVMTVAIASCSASVSSGACSSVADSVAFTSNVSTLEPVITAADVVVSQQDVTQTNTFGASMVTTIVTSSVSMGSMLSMSFSGTSNLSSVTGTVPMSVPAMQVTSTAVASTASTPPPPLPVTVSSVQSLQTTAASLPTETSISAQKPTSHSVPIVVCGPHQPGVAQQAVGLRLAEVSAQQSVPRIISINNGVHVDKLPHSMAQSTAQVNSISAMASQSVGDQYESLKPCTAAYTVHSCPVVQEDHVALASVIHVPLVQPIGNCVQTKASLSLENQPAQLVVASIQHVMAQQPFGEKNDLHPEEVPDNALPSVITRTVGTDESHTVIGVQSGLLQLDSTHCSHKSLDATSAATVDNRCSKEKHMVEQDKGDCKPSRGISIMKPLYDREWEIEEELHSVASESKEGGTIQKVVKSEAAVVEEVHTNQLHTNQSSNIVSPKGKTPFTIAQLLERADKQRRNQAQLKQKVLFTTQSDCIKTDMPVLNDSLNISQIGNKTVFQVSGMVTPIKSTKSAFSVGSTSTPVKTLVSTVDFGKNASAHLANFVQKSLQTPILFKPAPHPITSPGFPLNLTESVKKVMNAIPRTDTTPPPSPVYNKGPTSLPAPLSPSRLRAKSTSPIALGTGSLSHLMHKRNTDSQPPVSGESSTSQKPNPLSDENHDVNDRESHPRPQCTLVTAKKEIPAELDSCNSCTNIMLKASNSDAKSAASLPVSSSVEESWTNEEPKDQTPVTKKYDGSGDDSFSSEHSYSARPPDMEDKPAKDLTPVKTLPVLDQVDLVKEKISDHEQERNEMVISLSASNQSDPLGCSVEQDLGEKTSSHVTDATVTTVLASLNTSPLSENASTEKLTKALPVSKTDGGSKIHMISPTRPILSTRDDREGTSQTLVIKIVGAHATSKEMPAAGLRQDAKISALPAVTAKESNVIDLSTVTMCQKPNGDGSTGEDGSKCAKVKTSSCDPLEAGLNHEAKAPKAEIDSESIQSLSPIADELANVFQKRRSPSIDALSETSSTDGHSTHSHRADSMEQLDSPLPRPTRMSTRNHGRRRNSPSDSSSDMPVKDEKMESNVISGTPKPSVITRGSKRRLHSNNEDEPPIHDKKMRMDSELADVASSTKHVDSKLDDISVSDAKTKSSSKTTPTKGKANSSHEPAVSHDEKQKGRKTAGKVNDISKDESNITKRGQKSKLLGDVKDDGVQQGKIDQKDDAFDTKGKRTTRSSRTKDHCELPNAASMKRRRSSRDHR